MQTLWELTAAEARAVTNLWRLRSQLPIETHNAIATHELSSLLGTAPDELDQLTRRVRRAMPFTDSRLSWLEAETVIALHAAQGSTGSERLPLTAVARALGTDEESLYPVVRDARERLAAALPQAEAMPVAGVRGAIAVAVGENPYSWQILWTVLLVLSGVITAIFWLRR